jgi:hypothetical protein
MQQSTMPRLSMPFHHNVTALHRKLVRINDWTIGALLINVSPAERRRAPGGERRRR